MILDGLFLGGVAVGGLIAHFAGVAHWIFPGVLTGLAFVLLFASAVYRRLHARPLFLPRCPHCRTRPEGYDSGGAQWPRETIRCGACRGISEILYQGSGSQAEEASTVPRLRVRWPYFIGRYKEIR